MAESVLNKFYNLRENFQIIALTGLKWSGISKLADLMCCKDSMLRDVRAPQNIKTHLVQCTNNSDLYTKGENNVLPVKSEVFKRKYQICYNFFIENYHDYTKIVYDEVAWLYLLLYIRFELKQGEKITENDIKENIENVLLDKFCARRDPNEEKEYKEIINKNAPLEDQIKNLVKDLNVQDICASINKLKISENKFLEAKNEDAEATAKFYFDKKGAFKQFVRSINERLLNIDFYIRYFFYHRFTNSIRISGNPIKEYAEIRKSPDISHLYDMVSLIKVLIKGYRQPDPSRVGENQCRIVIDSITNSMEANYLKERYSAFYVIAVHSDHRQEYLREKIDFETKHSYNKKRRDLAMQALMRLARNEAKTSDFGAGKITSSNTEQCISEAEIHITNIKGLQDEVYRFSSMAEQWMKYAVLIMHPGLITPSAQERCMIVAYTAKLNSGCISRQVGAVITNEYHSIRTIGWNDVPYGQIPCNLRDIYSHVSGIPDESNICYSQFELSEDKKYNGDSFRGAIQKDYRPHISKYKENLKGLPCSYCFKTLENRFSGEKNQVFTRSLHAEENAMLQLVKYGGENLRNGIIYVTASPCELCSKKLYQIGVRKIVYIDAYPGIAMEHIISCGAQRPELVRYEGVYGASYFKLYTPFISYKDELSIRTDNGVHDLKSSDDLFAQIMERLNLGDVKKNYTREEFEDIMRKISDGKDRLTLDK